MHLIIYVIDSFNDASFATCHSSRNNVEIIHLNQTNQELIRLEITNILVVHIPLPTCIFRYAQFAILTVRILVHSGKVNIINSSYLIERLFLVFFSVYVFINNFSECGRMRFFSSFRPVR